MGRSGVEPTRGDKGIRTEAKFKEKKAVECHKSQNAERNPMASSGLRRLKKCEHSPELAFSTATMRGFGAVDEWFKSHAWKACVG
jgi:hypothetical protein